MGLPMVILAAIGCGVHSQGELPAPKRPPPGEEGPRRGDHGLPPEGVKTNTGYRLLEVKDGVARNAVCNNGEPATYYVNAAKGPDRNKFVIFLQGGGYCDTVEDCRIRAKEQPSLMSAKTGLNPPNNGIVSDDPAQNPDFHGWSKVYLHYCSSDAYSGNREASEETGGYHFRGHVIFQAVIEDLKNHPGDPNLSSATEVILAGASAGGVGVQHNLDRLAASLPKARVVGLADAASFGSFYEDREPTPEELAKFRKRMEGDAKNRPLSEHLWNPVVDDTCKAALKEAAGRCMLTSGFKSQFIETPMFIAQDQSDMKYLRAAGVERGTVEAEKLGREIVEALEAWPHGGFSTDRGAHGLCKHDKWTSVTIPYTDGKKYSMADAFGNWYFDRPGPKKLIARR